MLELRNIDVYHGYVQALKEVSIIVGQGELLVVLGANGAGKSTLLGTMAGLYRPARGEVILDGKPITSTTPEKMVGYGVSLVPENREVFGALTVLDNLRLGAFHRYRRDKKTLAQDVREILEILPALKGREQDLAGSLSGGLQQMLAIGRGLMASPKLLLLDEPSIGLAPLVVREIMAILSQLKKSGVTIVLVEQNTKAALKVADRAWVMERGRISELGDASGTSMGTQIQEAYLGRALV